MKNTTLLLLTITLFFSCKQNTKTEDIKESTQEAITTKIYPENISKFFDTHGTLETWNNLESLVFEIQHPEGNEKTTTALKSRKSLIETEPFSIGYNGICYYITILSK